MKAKVIHKDRDSYDNYGAFFNGLIVDEVKPKVRLIRSMFDDAERVLEFELRFERFSQRDGTDCTIEPVAVYTIVSAKYKDVISLVEE